jgi:hypothetical protein
MGPVPGFAFQGRKSIGPGGRGTGLASFVKNTLIIVIMWRLYLRLSRRAARGFFVRIESTNTPSPGGNPRVLRGEKPRQTGSAPLSLPG